MGADRHGTRPAVTVVGFVLVASAGMLVLIAVFLPWIHVSPASVEETAARAFRGPTSPRDYSGWDVANCCGTSNGLFHCSIGVLEGRQGIVTGRVTAGCGVVLVALGIMGALSLLMSFTATTNIAWVGSCFAAGGAAGFATSFWWPSVKRLDYEIGVHILWVAALLAVGGAVTAAATIGRPRAASAVLRVLGAFGLLMLGWFGALLLALG